MRTLRATAFALTLTLPAALGGCSRATPLEAPAAVAPTSGEVADGTGAAFAVASTPTPATPQAVTAREVIREATVRMRARHPEQLVERARSLVEAHGGFVDSSTTAGAGQLASSARATFRLPTAQFDPLLRGLRGLGEVLEVSERGEDVTAQHADATARLVAKRQMEQRLLALGEHAGSVQELIQVETELGRVRGDIESMEAAQRGLEHRIAYATVTLDVEAPVQPLVANAESVGSKLANAYDEGTRAAVHVLAGTLVLVLGASPLLALVTLVGLIFRFARRRHGGARTVAHAG